MTQSKTFTYTGAEQTWTVPDGVDDVTVECWGAEGGAGYNNTLGDEGGYIKANISTTPGETLYLYVGGQGGNGDSTTGGAGGFPAGGNGGDADEGGGGGGGGGRSDLRQGGNTTTDIVIAAGGGGGAGARGSVGGYGGFGGYTAGEAGGDGRGSADNGGGGGGGTQSAGGSGGAAADSNGSSGSAGSQWAGGAGGTDNTAGTGGGGGGDGYYGGGGGGTGYNPTPGGGGGGGGGSSTATVSVGSSSNDVQTGDGKIVLTYDQTVDNLSIDAKTGDSVDLSWEDTFTSEDEYRVYRSQASNPSFPTDYTQVATLSANSTAYTDTGLEDGENYSWTVTAYNSTDGEFPEADPVSTTTVLPAPTLGSADVTATTEVTVRYTLNDDSSDGDVLIERSTDGGTSWSTAATVTDLTATEYVDTGLAEGEKYTYRVTRRTDHATQQTGTDVAITDLPAASSPTVTGVTGDQISISWTDNATNEDGYRVYVSDDGGATLTNDSGNLPAGTTSYQTTNLLDGERYILLVEVFTEHVAVDSMASQADTVSKEVSLAQGGTATVAFGSGIIGRAVLCVDDQLGGDPGTYDLTAERYNPTTGKWMPYRDDLTDVTYRTVEDDLEGEQFRWTLTCKVSGGASYQLHGIALNEGL